MSGFLEDMGGVLVASFSFFLLSVNGLLYDFIIDINYTDNSEITCRLL